MVTLAEMLNLPPFDDEAFIEFEALCRANMNRAISDPNDNSSPSRFRLEYMSRVGAAASEFGIDAAGLLGPDDGERYREIDFDGFTQTVFDIVTRSQIRAARRNNYERIDLSLSDKEKIKFQINRLRSQVESADGLSDDKKRAIYKRIDELLKEVDGKSVNLAKLMIILAGVAGLITSAQNTIIKGPETLVAIMDTFSIATGEKEERQALLERYRPPAIEDKSAANIKASIKDLDDEIPF